MTSILTNTSSMVALETLRGVNDELTDVQNEISTGKTVSSAKDDASTWAISTIIDADVAAYESVADGLEQADQALSTGRTGAESVEEMLVEIKTLITQADGIATDTSIIQDEIDNYVEQINSIVNTASYNGTNLLIGEVDDSGQQESLEVLSSITRDSNGNTSTSTITIERTDLTMGAGVYGEGALSDETGFSDPVADAGGANSVSMQFAVDGAVNDGDGYEVRIGTETYFYVAGPDETAEDVVQGLKIAIDAGNVDGVTVTYGQDDATGAWELIITGEEGGTDVTGTVVTGSSGGQATGGLYGLDQIDVTTEEGRAKALAAIDVYTTTATDAAAALGSDQTRISTQNDFISSLIDTLTTGVGSMVDADLEEASARLTALQTQQELAIEALSIANSTPETILTLFQR